MLVRIVEPLLGTRGEVHATAGSAAVAQAGEAAIIEEARRLEQLFTVFDPTSALNELRRTDSTSVQELIAVVELARHWHTKSAGAFDPQTQGLVELWDQAEIADDLPTAAAIAETLATRAQTGSAIDNLNAIAKGWIAQAALEAADQDSLDSVWLSLGGDIVHRGAGSMTIGIENPHRPYDNVAPMAKIDISNEAIATSGGARRWWTIAGRRYPKVIDPRTGWPVERVASASIVAHDAAVADVLATIATVASTEETLALVLDAGANCLLVHPDGSHTCSSRRFVMA